MRYECPPECADEVDHDELRCHRSRPVEVCLVHTITYPVGERCPICRAYIAAGL